MSLMLSCPVSLSSSSVEQASVSYSPELERELTLEFESKLQAKAQNKPLLILVGGFQGSGKSSLLTRIQKVYDANMISTDAIRYSLFKRGIKVSPEFSKYVSQIYRNLVEKSLACNANLLIDANAHSKRIEEIEKHVKEHHAKHTIIKVLLNASEKTLRDRVKMRQPVENCYQGTESDLDAALSSTKINPNHYDLIVDTDKMSENTVFERVNDFISLYFSMQFDKARIFL